MNKKKIIKIIIKTGATIAIDVVLSRYKLPTKVYKIIKIIQRRL